MPRPQGTRRFNILLCLHRQGRPPYHPTLGEGLGQGQGQDHIHQPRPQEAHQHNGYHQPRETHPGVHYPLEAHIHPTAEVGAHHPDEHRPQHAQGYRPQPHIHRDACPEHHPAEHIPSVLIRPQPVATARGSKAVGQGGFVIPIGGDEVRQEGGQHEEHHQHQADGPQGLGAEEAHQEVHQGVPFPLRLQGQGALGGRRQHPSPFTSDGCGGPATRRRYPPPGSPPAPPGRKRAPTPAPPHSPASPPPLRPGSPCPAVERWSP
ncbi:hypothetical protein HRbin23_01535 [bacterium HR23]|nr:hypothetical protein HRbin23_01535 [bacterium HR23]